MAKISILIALLLQLCTMMQGLSPCSEYFTYKDKPGTDEILGQVVILSPPKSARYHLKIGFNTHPLIHINKPVAQIRLAQPIEEAIQAIQQNRSLLYHVHFPLGQAIPRLTKIWFNDRKLCPNTQDTENITNIVMVGNVMYPPREPSSLDGLSRQGSSVNTTHRNTSLTSHLSGISNNTFLRPILTQKSSKRNKNNNHNNNNNNINNNNNMECGITIYDNRTDLLILNGQKALPGQWPWLAELFVIHKETFDFQCAASVLTNRHVLTAAHCMTNYITRHPIHPNLLEVAMGRYKLHQFREEGSVNREVASYIVHPNYNEDTSSGDADLAILNLRSPVEFSPFIKPICLWSTSMSRRDVINRVGFVVGYGADELGNIYTEEPRMARVQIVGHETCLRSHQIFATLMSTNTFCAGLRDGLGPCSGDSGTGMVIFDSTTGRYKLRGIVSRSYIDNPQKMCNLKNYVVYVDVAKYVLWIRQQISTT